LETCLRSRVLVERRHEDRQGAGRLPYFGCDTKSLGDEKRIRKVYNNREEARRRPDPR